MDAQGVGIAVVVLAGSIVFQAMGASGGTRPPADLVPLPPPPDPWMRLKNWTHRPVSGPDDFPIGVWLQDPKNAVRYKELGFNLYIGLWKGPTEKQLAALKKAGMRVVCAQNECGLRHRDDDDIAGWMHGDEPDNAQSFERVWKGDAGLVARFWPRYAGRNWRGYGPPLSPAQILDRYQAMKKNDPSRAVLLNLGQGVAWDGWHGRGVRKGHPEDYPLYIRGCDIVSFDIYPVVHRSPEVAGALWRVPYGVTRLRKWCRDEKIVWNCIECTHISNPRVKPAPHQVRAEVWMSIIFGSRGLIYFVHQFKPKFVEAALLVDPEMCAAVQRINRQVRSLASVINRGETLAEVRVRSSDPTVPVRFLARRKEGACWVFAVSMYSAPTEAAFSAPAFARTGKVEVLGENRTVDLRDGGFSDRFEGYAVHLYRIPAAGRD